MKTKELEIRNYAVELRAEADNRIIRGLAIPVEARSLLLGDFYEVISTSAITNELISKNDVKVYLDHDASQGTFARSKYGKGSLDLTITERGLEFEFEAPNTVFGNAILEGIKRGDYDEISFAFVVGDQAWTDNGDGTYTRTILSFDFLDEISILSQIAAYPQTNVATRSLETFKEELRAQEAEKEAEEARKQETIKKLEEIMQDIDNSCDKYILK